MKIRILLTLFCIASFGLAAETKPTPTPTPDLAAENKKLTDELATAKQSLTTTQQALAAIQQQRNQISAANLDAQASLQVLNGMLENANKELAELKKAKEPSPTPTPDPAK